MENAISLGATIENHCFMGLDIQNAAGGLRQSAEELLHRCLILDAYQSHGSRLLLEVYTLSRLQNCIGNI